MTNLRAEGAPRTDHATLWWGVLWRGGLVWGVPFVGTAPLVGADGTPAVPFAVFKATAVGLLVGTLLVVRRWPARGWRPGPAAGVYAAMSVVLDLAVLVGALRVPLGVWAATVLPAYALVPLVLLARRRGDSPAG